MIRHILPAFAALSLAACAADLSLPSFNTGQAPTTDKAAHATPATEDASHVNTLSLERLFQSPSLNGPSPRALAFSPDGSLVTFLKPRESDSARYDLWAFDVATGEAFMLVDSTLLEPEGAALSEEEKALRERQRIAGTRGIARYDWGTADTILVPIGGDLHLVRISFRGLSIDINTTQYADRLNISADDMKAQIREAYFNIQAQRLARDFERNMVQDVPGHVAQSRTGRPIAGYEYTTEDGRKIPIEELAELEFSTGQVQIKAIPLTQTDAFEFDAKVSPGGKYVSFIRDGALHAIELATGEETQLSPDGDAENALSYGTAEFVAQEEMGRYTGYWWSPDERYVAYTRVDESTVDIVPRADISGSGVTTVEQRYPKAGRPNAVVDLFVRDMRTGEAAEIEWRREDWGPATDQYLARVNWDHARTGGLMVQRVDRDQTWIEYVDVLLPEGLDDLQVAALTQEQHDTWVNLSNDLLLASSGRLLTSEMSGARHIVEFDADDAFRQITAGDWAVSAISGYIDGTVYFTGYKDTVLEQHLYSVPFAGGEPTRITPLGQTWSVTMASDGQSYIGTSSSATQPPQVGLYRIDGTLITWIEENALNADHPYAPYLDDHTVPEFGTLKAEDGQDLYYSIQLPPAFDAAQQYPVIIEVYGGPGSPRVFGSWRSVSDQYLTREGYIVFRLDNRGVGRSHRSRKFEDVIYRQMGQPEVRDQLVGVDYLKSLPYVDGDRIAIQGWSYGGYMTLMTVLQAPQGTFAAAVAGAPVTDWALYDTFYTERYMDTPQDNADGYEASSVFPYLDNLNAPLLLMHGMADDNVVFENSVRLYAELQQRDIPFEMMTYPGERHGIRGEALRTHLMKTRMAFLNRHLKEGE